MYLRLVLILLAWHCAIRTCSAATLIEDVGFEIETRSGIPGLTADEVFWLKAYTTPEIADPHFAQMIFFLRENENLGSVDLVYSSRTFLGTYYLAEPGQAFSDESIGRGDHRLWGPTETVRPSLEVPLNEDIWVGMDLFEFDPGRQHYGWFQLRIDDSLNVALLDNAMAYNASQIVIGEDLLSNGDINRDGFVDASDLNVIGKSWLNEVDGVQAGDLTGDGVVDAVDLNVIGKNWSRPQLAGPVPEPSSNTFVCLMAVSLLWLRRAN